MESFTSSPNRHRITAAKRIRDGRLQLAGGTIAYTLAGTGPALLLVHGLGGNRQTWQPLLAGLARTHTVIAPDLPGHGESDAPAGDYSLGSHASTLRDLLLALGHPRVSIVGHSLGGGVALQTAYQFPERIERVMLISSGGLDPEVSYLRQAATLPGAEAIIAALSIRHIGLLRDVPVLVAWGADDTTIPPRHHLALAEHIPHAVMAEVTDADHYPHETASAQMLSAMGTFLNSTQPFRYSEVRWVEQLTGAPGGAGAPAPSAAAVERVKDVSVEDLQLSLESRKAVDTAIGILVGLRGCSQREAVHEFVGAVNETGITSAELGRALADVVSGKESSLNGAEPLRRWSRLLEVRGHAVRVRYGPNESNIC